MPRFRDMPDKSLLVWKYMDFDNLVHLLATSSLWLTPLSELEDRREGNWCNVLTSLDYVKKIYDFAKAQTGVSCWSLADSESLYMWDSYTTPGKGVAIVTTVDGLEKSYPVERYMVENVVFALMKVVYEEQPVEILIEDNKGFDPVDIVRYKSSDFSHEDEVRFVYSRSILNFADGFNIDLDNLKAFPGARLPVNLNQIIQSIYISPKGSVWLHDCVTKILDTLNIENIPVLYSSMWQHFNEDKPNPIELAIRPSDF